MLQFNSSLHLILKIVLRFSHYFEFDEIKKLYCIGWKIGQLQKMWKNGLQFLDNFFEVILVMFIV